MACPGGCIAGAGTIQPINKSAAAIARYKKEAEVSSSVDSKYAEHLELLHE